MVAVKAADSDKPLRPVMAAYTLEVGASYLSDTYLTPLKYKGQSYALSYERMQAMRFSPENWVMRLTGRLGLNRALNPARNAAMWDLDLELSWGMMHRWQIAAVSGLQLYGGGSTMADIGALYLARNGNNPVAAKAAWTVGITGAAVYNFKISRLPICLRYQPTLPVTGVFFSPDYGELYYEIYLGNHSGLVHGAWWGNYFRLNNLLTADLRLGATNLRIGYSGDILSTKVNNIVTRRITHAVTIGVSGEWLSVNRSGKVSSKAKIISALY
ncbi:MAG: DUF3316 domain-containing protein [Muribaculaceae bacterium]|nr:DUF3316 domain-containing protein [Muribaculaceae bacterium]